MEKETKIVGEEVLLPSLRGTIGKWTYYLSKLNFAEVAKYISPITSELHSSEALRDQIQRSITDNYVSIKQYIIGQDQRFFNALVLAVYGGDPEWIEVELNYKKEEYFNLGFLRLTGKEIIFPVDGQHRVEGIKAAIKENKKLSKDSIPIILIGHTLGNQGMIRTRRLFSTLNRYAKPVSLGDIVALDEDDTAAIITRNLLETHPLFKGKRVIAAKQKAIPESDKSAITSLITLYQCNLELIKSCYKAEYDVHLAGKKLAHFLKFRPEDDLLNVFEEYVLSFWDAFVNNISSVKAYIKISENSLPASKFRENTSGGNLLFRPVGMLPFVQACVFINETNNESYASILKSMNKKIEFSINKIPWIQVIWNDFEKTMQMASPLLIRSLIIHMYDSSLLNPSIKQKMLLVYSGQLGSEEDADEVLNEIAG